MASEKTGGLLFEDSHRLQKQSLARTTARKACLVALSVLFVFAAAFQLQPFLPTFHLHHSLQWMKDVNTPAQCQQVDSLYPNNTSSKLQKMEALVQTDQFVHDSITRLSNAVRIPSISYDDLGPIGEDSRWEIFYTFESYLNVTFPLIHSKLKKENVNTHGLLYTWEGSDSSLKPTLLMAHQDVVPVPNVTVDAWTHPPFSGFYDGKYVWGRGASDCKNQLMSIMTSVELLLAAEFQPARTILLSFGFDEEVSGPQGAGHLAPYIHERYGDDSIAALVDEGSGMTKQWGTVFSTPAVGEKGYTDVEITIRMPGGHSSIPPKHTSIGVLSELITLIEDQEYAPRLNDQNPYLAALQCGAEHAEDFPKKLRRLLRRRGGPAPMCYKGNKDRLAENAALESDSIRYLMQTSQAVDLISGGAKVNALPERVSAVVNHRINIGEHPSEAQENIRKLAKEVAEKYGLDLHAYDGVEKPSSIMLSYGKDHVLEPAPVTPTDIYSPDSKALSSYGILSGTTRALYGEHIYMAPSLSTGNTDTRYYWALTKNIFRYGPGYEEGEEGLGNIHTVDEKQSVVAHVNAIRWFGMFIRNMDESKL